MEVEQEEYHKELSRTAQPIIKVFQRAFEYQYEVLPHSSFLYKQSTCRICVTFASMTLNFELTSALTHLCEILIDSRCHAIFLSNLVHI